MRKSVLIIIVFHDERSLEDTLESIRSVREIEYKDYDIIVVNNGMRDGAREKITSEFPDVLYLEAARNLGFAGGNNLGIDYGIAHGYDFLLLLNNDVAVAPDFLTYLLARINEDKKIGMVGPKTFYYGEKDKLWALGGYIIKWRALVGGLKENNERVGEYFKRWRHPLDRSVRKGGSTWDSGVEVDYLPASCILMKREVVERVGRLPQEYFFAYEEADFALAVKGAGYRVVVEPKAHIWHKVGLSSEKTPVWIYNSYRNRFLFLKRNFVFPANLFFTITLLTGKVLKAGSERKLLVEAFLDHLKYKRVEEAHLLRIKEKYNKRQASQ